MLIFFFFTHFIKGFWPFLCIFFANFAQYWAFFAHILCSNFLDSKFCVCYFVSFFHLWLEGREVGREGRGEGGRWVGRDVVRGKSRVGPQHL